MKSLTLTTNGHKHTISEDDNEQWSSDFFSSESEVRQVLRAMSDGSLGEEPMTLKDDTPARVRLLETALSFGLVSTIKQVQRFNRALGTEAWNRATISVFSSIRPGDRARSPWQLTGFTLSRLYLFSTYDYEQPEVYYQQDRLRTAEQIKSVLVDLGLFAFNLSPRKPKGIYPMFIPTNTSMHSPLALTETRIIRIIEHLVNTLSQFQTMWRWNLNSSRGTRSPISPRHDVTDKDVTWSHWADYAMICGWYEFACWERYGHQVLPALVQAFNVPNNKFIPWDAQRTNAPNRYNWSSTYGPTHWSELATDTYPPFNFKSLLPPQAYAEFIMIRALRRKHWNQPLQELDVPIGDLFPSAEEIIEAARPYKTAHERFTIALENATEAYHYLSTNRSYMQLFPKRPT